MTANIETLLDWMRQRVKYNLDSDGQFTYEHLVTLLNHIDKLTSDNDKLEDVISDYKDQLSNLDRDDPFPYHRK